jgi:DNA modification methylase
MERIVKTSSKEGGIILDPFMGSGTTAIACINTGRNYIGFELDKHYCDIANERIRKALADSMLMFQGVCFYRVMKGGE